MSRYNLSFVDIVTAISFFILVYFVLTRIFGHSATDLAIAFSSFFMLGGLLYKLNREIGEIKSNTVNSFSRLKDDMGGVKGDLSGVKGDISEMKCDIVGMKQDISGMKHDIADIKSKLK